MKRMAVLFALCLVPWSATAGELWITGGRADDAKLFYINYVVPGEGFIQDLGVASGGLDKDRPAGEDRAAIVLERMNGYDAFQRPGPTLAACALAAPEGQPIKVEVSLVLGNYTKPTDWCLVHWNGKLAAEFDSRHPIVEDMASQSVKTFELSIPAAQVRAENVLSFMPKDFRGAVIMVDAVRISGPAGLKFLPSARARELLAGTPVYESRNLKGKGKVLLLDFWRTAYGMFQYEIGRALNADMDVYPPEGKAEPTWLDPAKWTEYKVVIVSGRHVMTPEENAGIRKYMEQGGMMILTSGSLQYFLSVNAQVKPEAAEWTGGFLGSGVSFPKPTEVTYSLKEGPYAMLKVSPAKAATWTETATVIESFRAFGPPKPSEVLVTAQAPGDKQTYPIVFVRRVGKGTLVGTVGPYDLHLVELLRNIVASAVSE